MSELREWTASEIEEYDDARLELAEDGKVSCTKLYIKSEVDEVIAELQKQVHDYAQGLYVIQARADKDARHQKYKRCLAMARWCDEVMMSCELRGYAVNRIWANRHQWAMRWKYRWLELAKKFKDKEAK